MTEALVVFLAAFLGASAGNVLMAVAMVAAPRLFAKWLTPTVKAYEDDQRREDDQRP